MKNYLTIIYSFYFLNLKKTKRNVVYHSRAVPLRAVRERLPSSLLSIICAPCDTQHVKKIRKNNEKLSLHHQHYYLLQNSNHLD